MKHFIMIKESVSIAIFDGQRKQIIAVQRPADDEDLANAWGLPASSLLENESIEDAVIRTGKEKLGVELEPIKALESGHIERSTYRLEMTLYEAKIIEGECTVPQPISGITQYQQWQWGDASCFMPAAEKGSLCCRLFLKYNNKAG